MKKNLALLVVMLMGLTVVAIAFSAVMRSVNYKKHGVLVEATVLDTKRISNSKGPSTYEVTVSFTSPEGENVTATARKRNTAYKDDRVKVWYDPSKKRKIDFADRIGYNMRGVIIGAFIFFIGLYLFLKTAFSNMKKGKLLRSGQKIAADLVSIDRNERFRMGDKNPWVIKCRWIDKSIDQEYFFLSNNYTIDPAPYLNGRSQVDVYIDPEYPEKYYMDASFMPEGDNTL